MMVSSPETPDQPSFQVSSDGADDEESPPNDRPPETVPLFNMCAPDPPSNTPQDMPSESSPLLGGMGGLGIPINTARRLVTSLPYLADIIFFIIIFIYSLYLIKNHFN